MYLDLSLASPVQRVAVRVMEAAVAVVLVAAVAAVVAVAAAAVRELKVFKCPPFQMSDIFGESQF